MTSALSVLRVLQPISADNSVSQLTIQLLTQFVGLSATSLGCLKSFSGPVSRIDFAVSVLGVFQPISADHSVRQPTIQLLTQFVGPSATSLGKFSVIQWSSHSLTTL